MLSLVSLLDGSEDFEIGTKFIDLAGEKRVIDKYLEILTERKAYKSKEWMFRELKHWSNDTWVPKVNQNESLWLQMRS